MHINTLALFLISLDQLTTTTSATPIQSVIAMNMDTNTTIPINTTSYDSFGIHAIPVEPPYSHVPIMASMGDCYCFAWLGACLNGRTCPNVAKPTQQARSFPQALERRSFWSRRCECGGSSGGKFWFIRCSEAECRGPGYVPEEPSQVEARELQEKNEEEGARDRDQS